MTRCEWLETFKNDNDLKNILLSEDCVLATNYRRRRRSTKDNSTKACEYFWASTGGVKFRCELEMKYKANLRYNPETAAIKDALTLFISVLRHEAGLPNV